MGKNQFTLGIQGKAGQTVLRNGDVLMFTKDSNTVTFFRDGKNMIYFNGRAGVAFRSLEAFKLFLILLEAQMNRTIKKIKESDSAHIWQIQFPFDESGNQV